YITTDDGVGFRPTGWPPLSVPLTSPKEVAGGRHQEGQVGQGLAGRRTEPTRQSVAQTGAGWRGPHATAAPGWRYPTVPTSPRELDELDCAVTTVLRGHQSLPRIATAPDRQSRQCQAAGGERRRSVVCSRSEAHSQLSRS